MNGTRLLFVILMLMVFSVRPVFGWAECGHNIIASLAYKMLDENEQQVLIELLQSHPQFTKEFVAPEGIQDSTDMRIWLAGRAGYWPDVARSYVEWNRPNWHFQLGSSLVIGNVSSINVPVAPTSLPDNANLDTMELYVAQAIELNCKILVDRERPASDRALAICWLAHLVADSHQPCHAGSLYAEIVFPEGDRGANGIPTIQGRNVHSLWDGLLGGWYDAADVRRRMIEISSDLELKSQVSRMRTNENFMSPHQWLKESRLLAAQFVYTPEILQHVYQAQQTNASSLFEPIDISEDYLKQAGRIAQRQALFAAHRLATTWKVSFQKATP